MHVNIDAKTAPGSNTICGGGGGGKKKKVLGQGGPKTSHLGGVLGGVSL